VPAVPAPWASADAVANIVAMAIIVILRMLDAP
jgi:hypothetical protein